ncbi:hypothetical protein [Aureimonas leprariae]|uniref:Uncharacterized protein n=1 Tax=Plantimonas leprariae TaxID=2615207 RepID=A0A7V7TUZ3_9HYPH|nr:hypothetical protein [Aureimonas leprariae]KAB0676855.1 hypothetical protein F6X38_19995 [Aureimonas leprariae]
MQADGSRQDSSGGPRDASAVLDGIRTTLERLAAVPAVRDDPVCAGIMARMATPEGAEIEAFHALVEALEVRVGELSSGRAAKAPPAPADRQPTRRARTFLKL